MSRIKKTDENKPWAKKELIRDISIRRQIRNIFLIYCEGENTEPEYFKAFPVNTETLVEAIGLGMNRTALVREIIERAESKEFLSGQRNYDPDRQIWCVFDRDVKGETGEDEDFDEAVRLAKTRGISVAYSNDAFELWFCLHDYYIDSQLHRRQYFERLSKRIGINYEEDGKKLAIAKSMYGIFLQDQARAIRHAQRLEKQHAGEDRPSRRNPCTTVHELVLALNTCLKQ